MRKHITARIVTGTALVDQQLYHRSCLVFYRRRRSTVIIL